MNSTGYAGSSGRPVHPAISSSTLSVILLIVFFDSDAQEAPSKWAKISPVVRRFADSDKVISSTPISRRYPFGTWI